MNLFRGFIAIIQAIITFSGLALISVVLYYKTPQPFNYLLGLIALVISFFVARFVYRLFIKRGVLETMTGDNATFDLDELEPTPGSGVHKIDASELPAAFANDLFFPQHVSLCIWGDWNGRALNQKHKINGIYFDNDKNILSFEFHNKYLLKIRSPKTVLYSSSYIKITNATEVLWQVSSYKKKQYSYLNAGKKILTKSNTKWKPDNLDFGIGKNAIYLQG